MTAFLFAAAAAILLSLLIGLWRVWRGPSEADRLLTAQLFGTSGIGILLLLGVATQSSALFDVALILSLLAAVAMLAFVQRVGKRAAGPQKVQRGSDD
ncbi:MAG: pH regulation protein F [Idiomarina sp.]|nr:pH regulation protein F [Idiomarina sp.]